MNIVELANELERQKANSQDLIVDTSTVEAVPVENTVVLNVPEVGEYPLTVHAHAQLAEKLKIPKRYYDRMIEEGRPDLLAENVNAWMGEKDRRLLRILDGDIRAILSDRYRVMDNHDLMFTALEEFKQKETIEVHRADLTDTHMYIKAYDRTLVAEIREEDAVNAGLIIRNSEIGVGAFKVEPFILRQICTNGLIGEVALEKMHLGRMTKEIGFIDWSDETRMLEDQSLFSQVKDVIHAAFNEKIFYEWVDVAKNGTEVIVEEPIEAVNNVATFINIGEEQKNELLMHFLGDNDTTQYGLVNAITRTARDMTDVNEQVRLEGVAGSLLAMNEGQFEKVI